MYTQLTCIYFIILDATIYPNSPDDPTLLYEHETMAEPVENEDDGDYVNTNCCY